MTVLNNIYSATEIGTFTGVPLEAAQQPQRPAYLEAALADGHTARSSFVGLVTARNTGPTGFER
jgi:hypothetical protein